MVIFFTKAYNAETTLHRCVQSVLNQTCGDFVYYLCDNASTDKTWDIMQNYASCDKRIRLLRNEQNNILTGADGWSDGKLIKHLPKEFDEQHYYCALDADDEYKPGFLEKMLTFMLEKKLEVAACGTDMIDAQTGALVRRKALSQNITLEDRVFADCFPTYRNFMVTMWGSLASLAVLKKCDFSQARQSPDFKDTIAAMEIFRNAGRAGVLAESLHKYYISPHTDSYRYQPGWFWACNNLFRLSREYLLHYGEISRANEDYLQVLFLIVLKYILPRIQNADVPLERRVDDLIQIFDDDRIIEHLALDWKKVGIITDKSEFLREQIEWAERQAEQELLCVKRLIHVLRNRLAETS